VGTREPAVTFTSHAPSSVVRNYVLVFAHGQLLRSAERH
jgi:hypothetical protein